MNLKIKFTRTDIFTYIFIVFYLIETSLFDILPISNTIIKYMLIAFLFAISIFYFIHYEWRSVIRSNCRFLENYICLLSFGFLGINFIFTYLYYGQGLYSFAKASYHFLFLALALLVLYVFLKQNSIEKFLDKVTHVACIGCFIVIFNTIVYNSTGILLVQVAYKVYDGKLNTFGITSLLPLIFIYAFWKLFNRKIYLSSILEVLILLITVPYCYQSRVMLIFLAVTLLYMFLVKIKHYEYKKYIYLLFFMIIICAVFLGVFYSIFESFSTSGENSASTNARIREIAYYFETFQSNVFFGTGMLDVNTALGNLVIRGENGNNYPTDVGYIGALGTMGILYYVIFGILFVRHLKIIYKICKSKLRDDKEFLLVKALWLYFIFSSLTLLITDAGRILQYSILIALFEYINIRYQREKNEQ